MALYMFWIVIVNCYLAAVLIGMLYVCAPCVCSVHIHILYLCIPLTFPMYGKLHLFSLILPMYGSEVVLVQNCVYNTITRATYICTTVCPYTCSVVILLMYVGRLVPITMKVPCDITSADLSRLRSEIAASMEHMDKVHTLLCRVLCCNFFRL